MSDIIKQIFHTANAIIKFTIINKDFFILFYNIFLVEKVGN